MHLPASAIKFDRVQAGTVQRANVAKEYKFYDIRAPSALGEGESPRVFLHPASVLFSSAEWRSPFVVYFQKQMTSKVFLRDATEVGGRVLSVGCVCDPRDVACTATIVAGRSSLALGP